MSPILRLLMTLALTLMWTPSFLFIKLAVEDIPPLTIVSLRVTIGAAVLFMILLLSKRFLPKSPIFWLHSSMMAIFSSAIPFSLFCYAETTIDSALAALLNGGSPMFTAVLAHLFLPSDKVTPQKAVGVGLSSLGILCLFAPNIWAGLSGTSVGMLAATGAAFSYGMSHVYAKKYAMGQAPLVAPTAQLIACAAMMIPFALWFDTPWNLPMPSTTAMLGVGGMTLFGTIFAFILYYRLLEHCGAMAISMVACFFPVGGMILGFLFLGESLSMGGLMAAGLILFGMMLVNGVITLPGLAPRAEEA